MTQKSVATLNGPETRQDADTVYKFDRRGHSRMQTASRVTLLRREHNPQVYQHPLCSMMLINISDGGICARCDAPLKLDEPVSIFFPPQGPQRGFDLLGHVTRCLPMRNGYEIGIAFDLKMAA